MQKLPSQQTWDASDLHVVTENGEQCFIWRSNQLTYIAQDRKELPQVLAQKFGSLATKLDLSYNTLTSFRNINSFTNLSELVLDNNSLEDDQLDFKENLRLKTLSLNKNKLTNLYKLITSIKIYFPNLEFLSLIGNPLCPSQIYLHSRLAESAVAKRRLSAPALDGASATGATERAARATNERASASASANDPNPGSSGHFAAQMIDDQQADFVYQKYRYFIIYHLPNLRFLDSSPVSEREREEALKRCYWMKSFSGGHDNADSNNNSGNIHIRENPQGGETALDGNSNTNGGRCRGSESDFKLTIMSDYADACSPQQRAPPPSSSSLSSANLARPRAIATTMATREATGTHNSTGESSQQPRGAFSRLSYLYTGRNSEGNRFIRNQDL